MCFPGRIQTDIVNNLLKLDECFYICRICTGEDDEALNLKIRYFNERELNWDAVDTVVLFLRQ
jgi:hypothetical protein